MISLVPSITESLLAWRVEPVAVTRFCEAPGRPTVGGTKNPDVGAILALAPDVVLMDEEENRREDADALAAAGVQVVATAVRSLGDVAPAIAVIAAAAGVAAPAGAPGVPSGAGLFPGLPGAPRVANRARVFVPIWRRPWMTVSDRTYGSSLLAAAGLDNVFGAEPDPYPLLDPGAAAARRPDLVLAPSEPYPFSERHRRILEQEAGAPVVFVDGRDVFWWGVRTPAALDRLMGLASTVRPG